MPAGRPPLFNSPEALEAAVTNYFSEDNKTPTWVGLALHLGFNSRQALNYYMDEKPEFLDPLKKALSKIEENYEKGLFGRNPAGSIFALKNFGWKDKQEVENSGSVKHNHTITGMEIL